jgi:hypothetical protein
MNTNIYAIEIQTPFGQELADLTLSDTKCTVSIERGSSDFITYNLSENNFNGIIETDIPFECKLYFNCDIDDDIIIGTIMIDDFASVNLNGRIKA